jgi:hypothetical protein
VLGVDALVVRNANAAMLAELWSHPNASGDPAVFVHHGIRNRSRGPGVRAVSARVGGAAGELGHIVDDAQGPECRCGRRGCLETFASTKAIREQYQQLKGSRRKATSPSEPSPAMPVRVACSTNWPRPAGTPTQSTEGAGAVGSGDRPYVDLVRRWLMEDQVAPKKQRHTARRVGQRLNEEEQARIGESTVRNLVARLRIEIGAEH